MQWPFIAALVGFVGIPLDVHGTPLKPDCVQCEGIVEIDGQKIHLQKTGARGPYVVLEAGLGNSSSSWHPLRRRFRSSPR